MQAVHGVTDDPGGSAAPGPDDGPDEKQILEILRAVGDRFGPTIGSELLEARVRALYSSFAHARVHHFVPILVERELKKEFYRGSLSG
jgi:hypothetical protein